MLRLCSDVLRQVYVDGAQHRHDRQVEEGKTGQLNPRGGCEQGRSHGKKCAHGSVNPSPCPLQDLPHRAKAVLRVFVHGHGDGKDRGQRSEKDRIKRINERREGEREERELLVEEKRLRITFRTFQNQKQRQGTDTNVISHICEA